MLSLPIESTPAAIRAARESVKLTQAGVARDIGISMQTLQRFEYGTKNIPNWYIFSLAALMPKAAAASAPKTWRIGLIRHGEEVEYAQGEYAGFTAAGEAARATWPHTKVFATDTKARVFYVADLEPPAVVFRG